MNMISIKQSLTLGGLAFINANNKQRLLFITLGLLGSMALSAQATVKLTALSTTSGFTPEPAVVSILKTTNTTGTRTAALPYSNTPGIYDRCVFNRKHDTLKTLYAYGVWCGGKWSTDIVKRGLDDSGDLGASESNIRA